MHLQGRANLENFKKDSSRISYSDSKLYVVMLVWQSHANGRTFTLTHVDPGWVPTKMGGHGAPDDLQKGYETQTWLAVSDDSRAKVSGRYFHHRQKATSIRRPRDVMLQERFLSLCGDITGIPFPQ